MRRFITILALLGALALGAAERTAAEFVAALGPGVSLGYSLEIPSGDETAWGNPKISERQIELCRALGFKSVRFPIDFAAHLEETNGTLRLAPQFLGHIREIVRWCRLRELTVVLSLSRPDADVATFARHWRRLAEDLNDLDLNVVFEGFIPAPTSAQKDRAAYAAAFREAVRATGDNNTRRFLLVPTDADLGDDDRLLTAVQLVAPIAFTTDHTSPEFDAAAFDAEFTRTIEPLRGERTGARRPIVIVETGAERQFRKADRRLPNDDARVRWAYAVAARARRAGIPVFLRETGCDPKTGLIDRERGRTTQPALIRAFVGGAKGTLTAEAAEGLADAAYVGLREYPKTDRLLVWNLDGKSYLNCWGQRMGTGPGSVSGNGTILPFFSSESDGSLRVSTNGEPVDMLHQFFWSDQSETAVETMRAYVYTHGETVLTGRRLVFTLTALNGTTAIVSGNVRIPVIKHEIPFGTGPDVAGALKATPAHPKLTVEIPLGDGCLDTTVQGGLSVELKLFPGPWNSARPLDCRISPIELSAPAEVR